MDDFLQNRTQRVSVNGSLSTWGPITSGVPQGSVLGPLLYFIYINDLPETINSRIKLFADDTKLYLEVKHAVDENKPQNNSFSACAWSKQWEMSFNSKKCKILHIGSGESSEYFVKDNNDTLTKIHDVDYEKDRGVTFDKKLNFSQDIITKVKLANRNLGIITKTFTFMDPEMFLTFYKSLVRPHLEYA